jgi:Subtilase family
MTQPNNFPHLPIPEPSRDRVKPPLVIGEDPQVEKNKLEREKHSNKLRSSVDKIVEIWQTRANDNSAVFPEGIPLLIEVSDARSAVATYLTKSFKFSIIAQPEEKFLIVASKDKNLKNFIGLIEKFRQNVSGSGNIAKVFQVGDDFSRLETILSGKLKDTWGEIKDEIIYNIDFGVSCDLIKSLPPEPLKEKFTSDDDYQVKIKKFNTLSKSIHLEQEEVRLQRETAFNKLIESYKSKSIQMIDEEYSDGTGCFIHTVSISGRGLRDIVYNFPFLFNVCFSDMVEDFPATEAEINNNSSVQLVSPLEDAPAVCIIDSGIQEKHLLLRTAIDANVSRCYVPSLTETDVADHVQPSGHGTRVAGVVIYGDEIPKNGTYQSPFWIQNARVLNAENSIEDTSKIPDILEKIVQWYNNSKHKTRIFNHSINATFPAPQTYMSCWASKIDNLSWKNDVLFIVSVGNLPGDGSNHPFIKSPNEHLRNNRKYPDYLRLSENRISDPAQSLQALTVGSIVRDGYDDHFEKTLGQFDEPASYSKTGLGIWDSIKPDVVEYGGDYVIDTSISHISTIKPDMALELINSTISGGPAYSPDGIGTSYATPKVARLVAQIQSILPDQPTLLYRALVVQSAVWPEWAEGTIKILDKKKIDSLNTFKHIGYGIPSLDRATANTLYRVTLISNGLHELGAGETDLYQIQIPQELLIAGNSIRIKISVTLSYVSEPKSTRCTLKGYLSTRLEWICSNPNEAIESFKSRLLRENNSQSTSVFPWVLGNKISEGQVAEISRKHGTLQKDWAIIYSHQLPDALAIGVRGIHGWGGANGPKAKYALVVTFEAVNGDVEIYDSMRNLIEQPVSISVGV